MDAFDLLKADHRKVEELFQRLETARGPAKLRVFEQIRMELELHTQIEEKIFYPALEKPRQTRELTLEAYEEHAVVKDLLKQLSRARTADEEWEAQAKVLQENVEHHVQEEENELFPKADEALSEEDIEGLGERMAAEKERRQRGGASKSSSAKKSRGSKKSASKSAGSSKAAKKAGSKKGGTKKGGSKKAGSKKGGSKKGGTKKAASKKGRRSGSKKGRK